MSTDLHTPAASVPSGPTDEPEPGRRPARRMARAVGRGAVRALAVVGIVSVVGLAVGVVSDYRSFDQTRGGYEAPYEGWTGTPIDWDTADVTTDGFRNPGVVVDFTLDCTNGMIGLSAFGADVDFRVVSERALAVHQPREGCADHGFQPEF